MEQIITLLIPAMMAVVLVRAMLLPMKWVAKVGIHAVCGFACLWLLNLIAPFTGIQFPVNAATVCIAGLLGLPGIAVMALLAVM